MGEGGETDLATEVWMPFLNLGVVCVELRDNFTPDKVSETLACIVQRIKDAVEDEFTERVASLE